jgi:hypothetical protein
MVLAQLDNIGSSETYPSFYCYPNAVPHEVRYCHMLQNTDRYTSYYGTYASIDSIPAPIPAPTQPAITTPISDIPFAGHAFPQPHGVSTFSIDDQLLGHGDHTRPGALVEPLAKQLDGNIITTTHAFIYRLFPTTSSPFPVDDHFFEELTNNGVWNKELNRFQSPPTSFTEEDVGIWLNWLGDAMGMVYSRPCDRRWHCGVQPWHPSLNRYPNLVLLDTIHYQGIVNSPGVLDWRFVRTIGEVTPQKRLPEEAYNSINAKSYLMFLYQSNRRFVPALSITGSGMFSFTLTDCEGQIRLSEMDLLSGGRENCVVFLTILAFLMFGSHSDIGLDPHIQCDPDSGEPLSITVDEQCFEVLQCTYLSKPLIGRGTKVWIVTRDGTRRFVVKDSWTQEKYLESEVEHLQKFRGHEAIKDFVPTLICGGDVVIDGVRDSTGICRGEWELGPRGKRRVHRRLVTSPVGEPITSFRSKKEFIWAMICIITGVLVN